MILLRIKIWWGKTCFLPGASIILLMPRKNTNHLWLWESAERGIFLHRIYFGSSGTDYGDMLLSSEQEAYEKGIVLPWEYLWPDSCIRITVILAIISEVSLKYYLDTKDATHYIVFINNRSVDWFSQQLGTCGEYFLKHNQLLVRKQGVHKKIAYCIDD